MAETKINSSGVTFPDATVQATAALFKQAVSATYSTATTTASTIPCDGTIPQNTEGAQILSLAITPKSATSKLYFFITANVNNSNNEPVTVALFQDSTANALASYPGISYGRTSAYTWVYTMTSGTTSATTFKVRVGSTASTTYINRSENFSDYATVSSIVIMESV